MTKTSAFLLSIFLLSASSCSLAQDKNKTTIVGSGNLVTRDIPVSSFDALNASGVFSIVLTQGNKEQLKIEAEDNLQDLFIVKNEGSTLKISMKDHVHFDSKKKMKVYISFKTLKTMELGMVGSLTSEGNLSFDNLSLINNSVGSVEMAMNAQTLNIKNSSVGNLKLSGKVENAVITNTGVGSFKASGLVVQVMDIENEGVGSAEVNAAKELKVSDSFLGKVKNVGNAPVKKRNKQVI
jgi:hypothetical protein